MPDEKTREIIDYHERVKHHFNRFARSLGYMDWENQPEPFLRFGGRPMLRLPLLEKDPDASHLDLYSRQNNPERPFTRENVAGFLELSMALSAWKGAAGNQWALRINPSSGNLHPTEAHLAIPEADWIEPGVYHYNPLFHALEPRAHIPPNLRKMISDRFKVPGFFVALGSIYWREAWKYGERAFRYCNHDVGHALACMVFSANLFGWKAIYLNAMSDADVETVVGLDKPRRHGEEKEHPDLLCHIFPSGETMDRRDMPPEIVEQFEKLDFFGLPNRLSRDHFHWEAIERAAENAEKPRTKPFRVFPRKAPLRNRAVSSLSAARIIRNRRSAQAYDRTGAISREQFFSMLDKTIPRQNTAPFDVELSTARIHLLIFVHNVEGLQQGLYFFVRNEGDLEELRGLSRPGFSWNVVEEGFPLHLLREGDFREEAARVSCHQDIAGESAFSLGMIAKFRDVVQKSPFAYKSLFWESGMIGQVLYLESEAFGARGTGIGCFFDDAVHGILGLEDNRFQSIYHFTSGKHLEDRRLRTFAPYYHLEQTPGS